MKTFYLDTETTGLNPDDEVLEIGLVGEAGEVLFESLIRPRRAIIWPEAQTVNGITPEMVVGMPYLSEVLPELGRICQGRRLVIYNAAYDLMYVPILGKAAAEVRCAKLAFAKAFGEWDDHRRNWKWQRLEFAARHVGHDWGNDPAHRAVADAMAARSVWLWCEARDES